MPNASREPARGTPIPGEPRSDDEIRPYVTGEKLYGDDFDDAQLQAWYAGEAEGYSSLDCGYIGNGDYVYPYTEELTSLWYEHLPAGRRFAHAMSFGGALCDELKPIVGRLDRITVVEPSDAFVRDQLDGVPTAYVKPRPDGVLPFGDGAFDLISCHGVLHHVANVSKVVLEMGRVLRPDGFLLLAEPTVAMGDWRYYRGLTRNERGIPLRLFDAIVARSGLRVARRERYCNPLTERLGKLPGVGGFVRRRYRTLDRALCRMFAFNTVYLPSHFWERPRPVSVAYVLQKTA